MPTRSLPLPELPESLSFLRLLWMVDHQLWKRSKRMARQRGVTGPQRVVIRLVGLSPGVDAGTLARWMSQHPSTLTGVLHRLEEHGHISRTEDPADRRRAQFALTERGREIDAAQEGTVEACIEQVLRELPPEVVAATRAALEALARGLAQGG